MDFLTFVLEVALGVLIALLLVVGFTALRIAWELIFLTDEEICTRYDLPPP